MKSSFYFTIFLIGLLLLLSSFRSFQLTYLLKCAQGLKRAEAVLFHIKGLNQNFFWWYQNRQNIAKNCRNLSFSLPVFIITEIEATQLALLTPCTHFRNLRTLRNFRKRLRPKIGTKRSIFAQTSCCIYLVINLLKLWKKRSFLLLNNVMQFRLFQACACN